MNNATIRSYDLQLSNSLKEMEEIMLIKRGQTLKQLAPTGWFSSRENGRQSQPL